MQDVYKNVEYYSLGKKYKVLIVFDMIACIISKKKLNSKVTELFIRGRKVSISIVLITQSYFKLPKEARLSSMLLFVIKIPNKIIHQILNLKIL